MELYKEDLEILNHFIDSLDHISSIDSDHEIHEIEIRVRLYDDNNWVVFGYGEAGPCVLRFEKDPTPVTITYPNIHVNPTPSPFTTINFQSTKTTCGMCGKSITPGATVCPHCYASDDDE